MLRSFVRVLKASPRVLTGVGLLCVAGGLAGYQLLPEPRAQAAEECALSLAGQVPAQGADPRALAEDAARRFLHERIEVHAGPEVLLPTRGALGAVVDVEHLTSLIGAAQDPRSGMRRLHAQLGRSATLDIPVPASLRGDAARNWLLELKGRLDQARRDARVNVRTGAVSAERDGVSLDLHESLDALERALRGAQTEVTLALRKNPAQRSAAQLTALDFSAVLGEFETRYSTLEKDKARTENLEVAAKQIDGLVLMPGEELDFNAQVGERSEANGFRVATVIAAGQLADGVGGGTCQIAGTLHAAAYFAGLEFEEHHPHSRPSSYIKLGLDAVVVYPKLNLRVTNPHKHPIALGVRVGSGRVRVQVRGPATAPQRMVSFVRRVDEVHPYEERDKEDPTLPSGVRVLSQRGVPGFTITSFRVVRDLQTGRARRQRRTETYPSTTQVWRVGSGGEAPEGYEPPAGDTHNEYVADAYLEMTFDPETDSIAETRRAGDTGTPGWTAKLGMPQPVTEAASAEEATSVDE